MNEEVPEGCVLLSVGLDEGAKQMKDYVLGISFPLSSDTEKSFEIKLGKGCHNEVFKVEGIKGSMMRNLPIKKFEVFLIKLGFWGKKKPKGEWQIPMRGLETDLETTEEIKVPEKTSKSLFT